MKNFLKLDSWIGRVELLGEIYTIDLSLKIKLNKRYSKEKVLIEEISGFDNAVIAFSSVGKICANKNCILLSKFLSSDNPILNINHINLILKNFTENKLTLNLKAKVRIGEEIKTISLDAVEIRLYEVCIRKEVFLTLGHHRIYASKVYLSEDNTLSIKIPLDLRLRRDSLLYRFNDIQITSLKFTGPFTLLSSTFGKIRKNENTIEFDDFVLNSTNSSRIIGLTLKLTGFSREEYFYLRLTALIKNDELPYV